MNTKTNIKIFKKTAYLKSEKIIADTNGINITKTMRIKYIRDPSKTEISKCEKIITNILME